MADPLLEVGDLGVELVGFPPVLKGSVDEFTAAARAEEARL